MCSLRRIFWEILFGLDILRNTIRLGFRCCKIIASMIFTSAYGAKKKHKSPLYCYEEGQHDFHIRIARLIRTAWALRPIDRPTDNHHSAADQRKCNERTNLVQRRIASDQNGHAQTMLAHGEWDAGINGQRKHRTIETEFPAHFFSSIIYWKIKSADIRTLLFLCKNTLAMRR